MGDSTYIHPLINTQKFILTNIYPKYYISQTLQNAVGQPSNNDLY